MAARALGVIAASFLVLGACGDPDDPTVDAATDAPSVCTSDEQCDDGAFCNGEELCLPRAPGADARGCATDRAACQDDQVCDEEADRCRQDCAVATDADGDGADAIDCGGEDCDDTRADVRPDATEVCDPDGRDEDCDPTTFGDRDDDGDDHVDDACCNGDRCGDDCDDEDDATYPGQVEACNERDDDCDGDTDETVLVRYVVDADRDGHGAEGSSESVLACAPPAGYAEVADDCDDAIGSVHPGAYDRCDGTVDDDCSGTADDPPGGCACANGSSRTCPLPGACGASTQTCVAGTWPECAVIATDEVCGNGLDEDCDGAADDGCTCDEPVRFCGSDVGACERGVQVCANDGAWSACFDAIDPTPETCNDVDDDCDGTVDEGVFFRCWDDGDGDGYATLTAAVTAMCRTSCPAGTTSRDPANVAQRDCDPGDGRAFPGQTSGFGTPRPGGSFDFDCNGAATITSFILSSCADDGTGRCVADEGIDAPGPCGSATTFRVCAPMSAGSSGTRCEQAFVCGPAENCGDSNRVACR
ncbi:putative metal-binding motif-containing protein [Sandaracinus amylolyticus]|uniref:putative metal-binding motif-containing protein n=1 Tax=Sandaracinus amylolyticus TaxID=927083 RepID=UPI0009FAD54D|nr:putative metal-binding motif-containing protein [Sandaracinus amylolyticus]